MTAGLQFRIPLATTGSSASVLLPRMVSSTSAPARTNDKRSAEVTTRVFVTSDEERYPDLFGFTDGNNAGRPKARLEVLRRLTSLPRHAVDLSHDQAANTRLLNALTASMRTEALPGLDL
ncbi:hypothetical protein [Streptomyces sp. NPDC058045]|uniref:hypothetical protein n=1 Tax=Streptomyces sp. NPDC058045 TaxID=3346311 RepID=UPI0036EACF86